MKRLYHQTTTLSDTSHSQINYADGLACFSSVQKAGRLHSSIVTGGGPDCVTLEQFTWVNTLIGNVKNTLTGTYYSVSEKHLPRYLTEFLYRFNRRFQLEGMISRLACVAVRTSPLSMQLLKVAEGYG